MFSAPIHAGASCSVLTPLNFLFSQLEKAAGDVCSTWTTSSKMSQEELLMLVDEVQQDGSIDENEGELAQERHRVYRPGGGRTS